MGRKRYPPNDPREWLNRARSCLAHARAMDPDVLLENLCFDAQQAAEMAIKAVFIFRSEPFAFVHELKKLLQQLKHNGLKIPKYMWEADELSDYAVVTRYPGTVGPVTLRRYRRAVRLAAAVVGWAERQIT
jgi:HEPN domain-containing protein